MRKKARERIKKKEMREKIRWGADYLAWITLSWIKSQPDDFALKKKKKRHHHVASWILKTLCCNDSCKY
jgi:hypothetical protein